MIYFGPPNDSLPSRRWDDKLGGLADSYPKELFAGLPVVLIKVTVYPLTVTVYPVHVTVYPHRRAITVRETPSWPISWANCSLFQLYSHPNGLRAHRAQQGVESLSTTLRLY
jgi:hypothetical protein